MVLVIDGRSLRLGDVIKVATNGEKVEISSDAEKNVVQAREYLQNLVKSGDTVYGINTGVGDLANVKIDRGKLSELQLNIVRSHSAGYGNPANPETVSATMLILANSLLRGNSGIRLEVIRAIVDMLNNGVIPVVPEKGSIGASGDLAPLAHIALTLIGEGKAIYKNEEVDSPKALKDAKIEPVILEPKEGLSLINGCHYSTAILTLQIEKAKNLLANSFMAEAVLVQVLSSPLSPFDSRLQNVRPHKGQIEVAEIVRRLLKGSKVSREDAKKPQDAYSIRCYPQVAGAVVDTIKNAQSTCEIEMNSSVDNPLLFADEGVFISGGNFHGQPVAFASDFSSISITALSALMERQLSRILDSKLSGLSAFLSDDAGFRAGYMIAQYTATALLSESRVLSNPASIEAIPVSASQEDSQSMAPVCAMKLRDIVENAEVICGILLMCLAQAIDLAGIRDDLGKPLRGVYDMIRKHIAIYNDDRPISDDIKVIAELVRSGAIVSAIGMDIETMMFG